MLRRTGRSTYRPKKLRRHGFSMMEIVVTTLIMGIMAGVAVPRIMSDVSEYRAEAAANRIASDLRLAQKHARTTGRSETVTFDVNNGRYSFSTISDPTSPNSINSIDISEYPYSAQFETVDIGGAQSVTFNGLGLPGASGTLVVTSGQTSWGVNLDAASGTLTVDEESSDAVSE